MRARLRVALALWLLPELAGALAEPRDAAARAARRDRGSGPVLAAGMLAAAAGAVLATRALPNAALPERRLAAAEAAGDALIVAGAAIRWLAIASLGRSFTRFVSIRKDHAIVETGPYRYVRHPSYAGVVLSFAGFGFALGNVASLAAIGVALAPALAYRIAVEEAALAERLGPAYEAYGARTARLVPWLF